MTFHILYKEYCPYSQRAVELLKEKKAKFVIKIAGKNFTEKEFKEKFGPFATYPRVYKDGEFIGGYDDLEEYFN